MIIGIGERIALLRKSKNLTQVELANKLNISHQSVSKWERSESYPDISMFIELRRIFETTIDYIITGEQGNNFSSKSIEESINLKYHFATNEYDLRNFLISSLDKGDSNLDLDCILEKLPSIDLRDVLIYALDKGKNDFSLSKALESIPSIDLRDVLLVAIEHGKYDFHLKKVIYRLQPSEFEDLATAIENDGVDTNLDTELDELRNSVEILKVSG
ncbi:helix-turn-helix transcriptional regulator [Mycoplasmatota bacterium zrk1]